MLLKIEFENYNKYRNHYSEALIDCLSKGLLFDETVVATVGQMTNFINTRLSAYGCYPDGKFPGYESIQYPTKIDTEKWRLNENSKMDITEFFMKYGVDNTIRIYIDLLLGGTGEFFHSDGAKLGVIFFFHSNESNHSGKPHVHVRDINSDAEFSFDLIKKKIIKHKTKAKPLFNRKKQKRAIEFIIHNIEQFDEKWNIATNGFNIEIIR